MAQYIDKAAVVAEIERKIDEINQFGKIASYEVGLVDAYMIVLSFLDTIEVKYVDYLRSLREKNEENQMWMQEVTERNKFWEDFMEYITENAAVAPTTF